uniref:DUF5745 domain-containing protein n=1 Tax=Sphenodon punctatus TaxID=8508 RepID=A0A8D0GAR7_SPHPU
LLGKCNLNLCVKKLSECGANVFVGLYESILQEKVPDFIVTPRSQEDDAHNVQAVIDSLALDYLQVSLSHITGENVVKGDKESIQNLLEIFDGLLEYLTEEISEAASHNGGDPNQITGSEIQSEHQKQLEGDLEGSGPPLKLPSAVGSSQSSEIFVPSWEVDGSESTSELIRLGDTAYSFSLRKEDLPLLAASPAERESTKGTKESEVVVESSSMFSSRRTLVKERAESTESVQPTEFPKENLSSSAKKLGEPIRPAIPFQPPYQPSERRPCYPVERVSHSSGRSSPIVAKIQGPEFPVIFQMEMTACQKM